MGFDLGPLSSLTKALDPGHYIKEAVNSVLPKNMAVVGDVAGALFDVNTGNLVGAAQLGMDAMKDLPQATKQQGQQGATNNGASASANPNLEPSPPPNAGKPIDMNQLADMLNKILELLGKKSTPGTADRFHISETMETIKEKLAAKAEGQSDGGTKTPTPPSGSSNSATTTTTTTTTTHHHSGVGSSVSTAVRDSAHDTATAAAANAAGAWVGTPTTPPPPQSQGWRGSTNAAPPAPTTAPAAAPAPAASPASTAAPAAPPPAPTPVASPSTSAAGSANGQTITSLDQFNSMSDSAVRDAVIHGRISPELAKDQTAMMAIQQRMNAISEMNNLMTNMMKALHDMQMAVIQNVRV
jgi:hypothetical protein